MKATHLVLLLFISIVPGATRAQVHLTLIDDGGKPLPNGSLVAVISRDGQSHTNIEDLPLDIETILSSAQTDTLGVEGRTGRMYDPTRKAGKVYYVVVLTPEETLYESHVKGGLPGFDTVDQGRMTMRRAGAEHEAQLQQALSQLWSKPETRSTQDQATSPPSEESSEQSGFAWYWLPLMLILGAIVSGAGTWYVMDRKLYGHMQPLMLELKGLERDIDELKVLLNAKESELVEIRKAFEESARKEQETRKSLDQTLALHASYASSESSINSGKQGKAPKAPAAPPPPPLRDQVGKAFLAYCQQGGALLNRSNRFSSALGKTIPGATVTEVQRDRIAPQPRFISYTGDPIPYWLVAANGSHFLLPRPDSGLSFHETDPRCFDVSNGVSPQHLNFCRPAVLIEQAEQFVLKDTGLLR